MLKKDSGEKRMPIVKCKECGKEISSQAKTCPNCGYSESEKNIKRIVAIVVAVFIFIASITTIVLVVNKNKEREENDRKTKKLEEISEYSDLEVIEYLEDEGFEFEATQTTGTGTYYTYYIYVSNPKNEIIFQKYTNPFLGVQYLWKNDDINEEWAYIKSTYKNKEEGELQQFEEYEEWIESLGLTSQQLTDALDYYETTVDEYELMRY